MASVLKKASPKIRAPKMTSRMRSPKTFQKRTSLMSLAKLRNLSKRVLRIRELREVRVSRSKSGTQEDSLEVNNP